MEDIRHSILMVCHAAGRRLKIFMQGNTLPPLYLQCREVKKILLLKADVVPNDASGISPQNALCLRKHSITALKEETFH